MRHVYRERTIFQMQNKKNRDKINFELHSSYVAVHISRSEIFYIHLPRLIINNR